MRILPRIFRSYDIRGRYPEEINPGVVSAISRSVSADLRKRSQRKEIVVGHDGRIGSVALARAAGRAAGRVIRLGLTTTPMFYFAVYASRAAGGIMITASHNPKEENGMKIVGKNAEPIDGKGLRQIIEEMKPGGETLDLQTCSEYSRTKGFASEIARFHFRRDYISLLNTFLDLSKPITVVFDASNGTVGPILTKLFRGPHYHMLHSRVDGTFPAHGPNPLIPGSQRTLQDAVRARHADIGVIFDADGDRVFFVDDRGRKIDPDDVLYMLAMKETGQFLIDVRTGWLIRRHIPRRRWRVVPVGHTVIKRAMRRWRVSFAGERSGHYYFALALPKLQRSGGGPLYVDSGMIAALKMISFTSSLDQPLSAYIDSLPRLYRSGERSMPMRDMKEVRTILHRAYARRRTRMSDRDGLTVECENVWFNIRQSGTEDVLRLNAEAISAAALSAELARIRRLLG